MQQGKKLLETKVLLYHIWHNKAQKGRESRVRSIFGFRIRKKSRQERRDPIQPLWSVEIERRTDFTVGRSRRNFYLRPRRESDEAGAFVILQNFPSLVIELNGADKYCTTFFIRVRARRLPQNPKKTSTTNPEKSGSSTTDYKFAATIQYYSKRMRWRSSQIRLNTQNFLGAPRQINKYNS
uniref:Ribosomal protein S10 n=1 Tax=Romanomermis culicivorax TaxID=13658 RepID=A0A915J6C0_ROMCU